MAIKVFLLLAIILGGLAFVMLSSQLVFALQCDYTWGCYPSWMGANDGCDCTSSGGSCGDPDCGEASPAPAPAPAPAPQCSSSYVQSLSCPSSVTAGSSFQISFQFYGTGPTSYPYEHRSLWRSGSRIDCNYSGDWPACTYNSDSFTTTAPSTAGSYTYTVKSYGASDVSSSHCDQSDSSQSCTVTVTAACTPSWSCSPSSSSNSCGTSFAQTCSDGCGNNYTQSATGTACPATAYGSCTYSDSCDTTGDRTVTTYSSCNTPTSTCSSSSTTETSATACSRTTSTNLTSTTCSASNACGTSNSGFLRCDGACSVSAPSNPSSCTRCNNILQCNSGYECSGSGTCSVSAPSNATISSFVADPSGNVVNGTNVTYTVTASRDINVPASLYYMRIYETGVTAYRSSCGTGTTCAYSTSGTSQTKTFTAKIENLGGTTVVGTSSDVSTTWVASDTTAPTVTVSGVSSWQNTNAKADINCDDGAGVGCKAVNTWKWRTYDANPPANCPTSATELANYSGSYDAITDANGGVNITNHVWFCATAEDTNNNRGYTSTPVEFKIEKTKPTSTFRSTSPEAGSWQGADFLVFVDDEDTGGSNFGTCYYGVYSDDGNPNTNDWTVASGTTRTCDLGKNITVGSTGNCRNEGSQKCQVQIKSTDAAGNESVIESRAFSIDYIPPSVGIISPTTATINTPVSFQATVSDTGGSGLNRCYLHVDSLPGESMTITGTTNKTASRSHTFSTLGDHTAYVSCWDGADNNRNNAASPTTINVVAPTLSFPTGTWERLWYLDPKTYSFSGTSYRGRDTITDINKDWVKNELCTQLVCGGTSDTRKDKIGFKAGRTFTNLTPGAYTISVGADDGIKLFVEGVKGLDGVSGSNLLSASAWDNNHSWSDNRHNVRIELGSTAKIEIHYRENDTDAQISFAYSLGVVPDSGPICSNRPESCPPGTVCGTPTPYYPPCDFYAAGGICYYNSPTTGCSTGNWYSSAYYTCSYNSMCTLLADQACNSSGCTEGIKPTVTINTTSNQWYPKENPTFNLTVTDNVALDKILYQVDTYTPDKTSGTLLTSNGSSALSVSGLSSTTKDWKITNAGWDDLGDGAHTIYVKVFDTSNNCVGCESTNKQSFTIKKDTVAPTSRIKRGVGNAIEDDAGRGPGFTSKGAGVYSAYLNGKPGGNPNKRWWVYVQDSDGGSGVNTGACYVAINGVTKPARSCNSWVSFWVGSQSGADCFAASDNDNICTIKVWAKDIATNENLTMTGPTMDERNYLSQDFNEMSLGVDLTPPTAQ